MELQPYDQNDHALAVLRRAILIALAQAHAHDLCLTLHGLNARTNLPRETLRGIIADLRAEHLVSVQRGLFSDDGTPAGTGYHITEIGLAHLANKYRQGGTDQ